MILLLDPYVDAILVLALAFLAVKIITALFSPLANVAVIGGAIDKAAKAAAHAVSSACGSILAPLDHALGTSLHAIARFIEKVGLAIKRPALALAEATGFLSTLAVAIHAVRAVAHAAEGAVHGIDVELKRIEKRWKGIEHGLKELGKLIAAGLGADLIFHIVHVLKQWHKFQTKLLPKILKDIAGVTNDVANLRKWITANIPIPGTDAFVKGVTAVLALVGLDWIACKGRTSANGKSGCGLWDDLASLLFAAGIFGAALDFRDIVKAAVQLDALGAEAVHELTILDDAGIKDAAKAVSAAVKLVATAPTATGF